MLTTLLIAYWIFQPAGKRAFPGKIIIQSKMHAEIS